MLKTATIRLKTDGVAEVLVYDQIGEDPFFGGSGITSRQFREQIKAIKAKTMNLRINSPGGSVIEASAMLQALDEFKGRIEVDVDGIAASAASVLMMAGDRIRIASNGLVMIHNPIAGVMGGAAELTRVADLLSKVKVQLLDTYSRHATANREQLSAWMDEEKWFTGAEAVDAGLAHEASPPVSVAALVEHAKVLAKMGCKHIPKLPDEAAMEETRQRCAALAALLT